MTFIDFFAGIGTARMGFEQAGHECVYSVEWDKHKRQQYEIIHGKEPEGSDIRNVRGTDLPTANVWIAGFPCQDISIAGKCLGFEGNRSSLYFEVMRLLQETDKGNKPEYVLFENVKNFFSVNDGRDFLSALFALDESGYDAEWDLLNSKNFGVPQNRERVFIVGHLRGKRTRKVFPVRQDGELSNQAGGADKRQPQAQHIAASLRASGTMKADSTFIAEQGIKVVADLNLPGRHESAGRIYGIDGVAPSLTKCEGGGLQHKIEVQNTGVIIREATKKGYTEATEGDSINLAMPESKTRRGRVGKGIANTLDTSCNQGTLYNSRIRRLTPKECMRLQGVSDEITDKLVAAGISDSQLYRSAGDAMTVNVLYEIAKNMEVY